MKLGCAGCMGSVVALAVAALAVGGAVGATVRALARPDVPPPAATSPADGARAQRKLFDLARQGRRATTVTLSEAEINALLARHLVEARGVRLGAPAARLLGADVRVDEGAPRQLRLDVEDFAVGRQRLPAAALRLLLDPAAVGLLRWPLPQDFDSVIIEPGRVII